ncbi:hypothetical protein CW695_11420 [Macrococcoides caseolyticum]|uniref:DUF3427 domain-containing protein n=1 Tax=Macrococcoides caseolyticum TaxID=69966 RepID=UPI000C34B8C4|nr:hypothetical protein CW695_11420 [Macrococcus caseolyticus]
MFPLFLWGKYFSAYSLSFGNQGITNIAITSNNDLHLFVKKEDAENSDFYYLGKVNYIAESSINDVMADDNKLSVVRMDLKLQHPVPKGIYNYITEK